MTPRRAASWDATGDPSGNAGNIAMTAGGDMTLRESNVTANAFGANGNGGQIDVKGNKVT
ncbi:MAG: hypothetical protein R2857_05055 [Vampirovibrionales bacterium]